MMSMIMIFSKMEINRDFSYEELMNSICQQCYGQKRSKEYFYNNCNNEYCQTFYLQIEYPNPSKDNCIMDEALFEQLKAKNESFCENSKLYIVEPLIEAQYWESMGDYQNALKIYETVILKNPLCLQAITNLGNNLYMLNRFDESEEIYKKGTSLLNEQIDNEIIFYYCNLLEWKDRVYEATLLYEKTLKKTQEKYNSNNKKQYCYYNRRHMEYQYLLARNEKYNRKLKEKEETLRKEYSLEIAKMNKSLQEYELKYYNLDCEYNNLTLEHKLLQDTNKTLTESTKEIEIQFNNLSKDKKKN